MIVITAPFSIDNEIQIIRQLFEEGLMLLHVRKPTYSENEKREFVKAIGLEYIDKMVFHNFSLENCSCPNLHISDWQNVDCNLFQEKNLSTATHSIEEFNQLSKEWKYAFLSPVFESISKEGYGKNSPILETIVNRTNFNTELVALGGLDESNIKTALDSGFDSVALLGSIWLNDNPIQKFKQCQKFVHSY